MNCQKCNSERIADVGAKCSDLFNATFQTKDYDGYVPSDMGIGGGDYLDFSYCLDCGQIQGEWPLPETELEQQENEENEIRHEAGDYCSHCATGRLIFIQPDEPWSNGHLQCSDCDSTFPLDQELIDLYMKQKEEE